MNIFKATLDTRHQNGVIGTVTQFDNAVLELQIVTDGQVGVAWDSPQFELLAMKRDANAVREVEQDKFTILSKEDHKVQIELKEQFLTCRGTVKMQLIVKEGNRLSTTLFYLSIGQSLDHDIVDSHRDVAVLDELEAYIKQGFDDLAYQEQRMEAVEQSTNDLNDTMNANEAKRNKAETIRQEVFDTNEANRTRTFNSQVEEQKTAFSNSQTQRDESFNQSQQNMTQEFEASQRAREDEFDASQKSNQNTFSDNESKRQTTFAQSQRTNQEEFDQMMEDSRQTFDAAELKRKQLFDANEQVRGQNESRRVQNESQRAQAETQRAAAEVTRQQKMTQFEEKATQLSNDLDTQVARVDEFVTSNEGKLLGPNDKKDYMGNSHESVKEAMDANVDWLLGEINTVHYDGQHITAADSIEGHAKSAILSGNTLVNVLDCKALTISNSGAPYIYDGKYFTNPNATDYTPWDYMLSVSNLIKPNTDYFVILYNPSSVEVRFESRFVNSQVVTNYKEQIASGEKKSYKATSSSDANGLYVKFFATDITTTNTKLQIMILEYQEGMENWDIPYFEGIQSVKMPVLTTTGKNLINLKAGHSLSGGCTVSDEMVIITGNQDYRRYIVPLTLEAGTYSLQGECGEGSITIRPNPDGSGNQYANAHGNNTFTLGEKTTVFLALNTGSYIGDVHFKNIQLEKRDKVTSYEPYKSNILTVNEEVELRRIGDVKDELDCLTGELTQRIGEVVLDGSESWGLPNWDSENHLSFIYYFGSRIIGDINKGISDKLPFQTWNDLNTKDIQGFTYGNVGNNNSYVVFKINKTIVSDLITFKSWLAQNPIKIQYLNYQESVKAVDLSDNHVYSYKDVTHYDCSSAEGSLVPTLSIDVPTNLPAVVTRQRVTIQELEKENVALKNEIEETANSSVNGDLELMSSQFELDFRLFEIEMNLDMPMMAMMRGVKSMAMTVYQQAKTLILAGKYEREDMDYKLNRYKAAGRITVEEYEELIALMDARELVD